jgi:rhodanese-related sulfurtransferase
VRQRALPVAGPGQEVAGRPAAPDAPSGAAEDEDLGFRLELDQVRALHEARRAFFIDARPALYYENGHISSARHLPPEEYDDWMFDLAADLPLNRPIVIYCDGGDCTSSLEVAERLLADGYSNAHVYEGGYPEWEGAGLAVTRGTMP